jgi:alginate biosynthesis protein AlgX
VLADSGQDGGRHVDFVFRTASGIVRHAVMQRDDRMMASGRFYKSLGTLWHPDLQSLSVTFDQPVTATTSISLCRSGKEPL